MCMNRHWRPTLLQVIWMVLLLGVVGPVVMLATAEVNQPQAGSVIFLPLVTRNYTVGSEWTQEAHNAQRTGYSPVEPAEPWTLLWTWNGPDSNGGAGNHFYDAPREARTVAGAGAIYVPAGSRGLYALNAANGQVLWNVTATTYNATPAYDPATGYVFAGGANGHLYRINSATGAYQTYPAGSPINRATLIAGDFAYALTESGQLHKVNTKTLAQAWVYTAGATTTAGTGLAYSVTRDVIIFGSSDLFVHAVNNATGAQKWRVKPSSNPAGFPNEFRYYWPVVADKAGIVFLRMRLDHNAGLWGYTGNAAAIWPNSNAAARSFLTNNPAKQNLFALSLDDGSKSFIPAVGYGGVEDWANNQPYLVTGPLPVVKTLGTGAQVAYAHFRNGQSTPPDGRWDSHMGEMVLDNTTVPGLAAGDLRFVRMSRGDGGNSYVFITDEQSPISMAGSTIFHAHWGASEAVQITDRSNSRGLSYGNPITTVNRPTVIRRQVSCGNFNPVTHYTTCGLTLFGDGRYWDGPGFWTYWNVLDPPTPALNPGGQNAYSDGIRPRYTYVSANLLVVQGNGGELMVFRHSGQ